jgi:hypothetical protein
MPQYKSSARRATPISDAASYFSKNHLYSNLQIPVYFEATNLQSPYGGHAHVQEQKSEVMSNAPIKR